MAAPAPASATSRLIVWVRTVLAVLVGAAVWMVGFLALARILVALWPAYAVPARVWTRTNTYAFTAPMSVANAAFWILAELAAGWVAVTIARRTGAAWILAVLVMGYLCFMHLYYVWHALPWWYNLVVAFSSGPAVLLGGTLGSRSGRTLSAPQQTS
ncbi:MAG TPA: hypothetical protein VMD49_05675 [Steroidobacteraceae bacterium]|nr:hypothetical protein [Steroidobacteraceae bacterium]